MTKASAIYKWVCDSAFFDNPLTHLLETTCPYTSSNLPSTNLTARPPSLFLLSAHSTAMFLLSVLTVLAAGSQLGLGLAVPVAESRDLEKRIPGSIPIQPTTSNLWKYSKCQWDPTLGALNGYTFFSSAMTPDLCTITCGNKGYTYAGLRDKNYCGCGSSFLGTGYPIDKANCQYWPCAGNPSVACGGDFALGVYVLYVFEDGSDTRLWLANDHQ